MTDLFRHPQYDHQRQDLARSGRESGWAWFWEMGLGKTKQTIDTIAALHRAGEVDTVLVVAPNGVHANWLGVEIPQHQPLDIRRSQGVTYYSDRARTRGQLRLLSVLMDGGSEELRWLCISYDALCTQQGFSAAAGFLKSSPRTMMVLDESSAIKSPGAKRTKRCMTLGKLASYRRVMDGTPVAESPFDIYTQLKFLDPLFWDRHRLGSYFVFKQEFGLFRLARAGQGHQFQQLLEYRNLDKLEAIIKSTSTRYLKEDVLDLPAKVYGKLVFDLAPAQRKAYDALKDEYVAALDSGEVVEAPEAMVRLTRLQQITSGYVGAADVQPPQVGEDVLALVQQDGTEVDVIGQLHPPDANGLHVIMGRLAWEPEGVTPRPYFVAPEELIARVRQLRRPATKVVDLLPAEENPRLQLLLTKLAECRTKSIVWCRFVRDVDLVVAALGDTCRRYDGSVKSKDRERALKEFKYADVVRVLVANTAAIARGVTLTEAKTVFYYSNSFSLVLRLQSEDRAHRIGQTSSVQYYDIVARDTVDEHVMKTLREKHEVAGRVTGDGLRGWLAP